MKRFLGFFQVFERIVDALDGLFKDFGGQTPIAARRQLRPNAVLNSSSWVSNLVMSTFCERTSASSDLYFIEFNAALRSSVIRGTKNCGRTTYILG